MWSCTFVDNKRFDVSNKSHITQQPQVAVFDLLNLVLSERSVGRDCKFQPAKPGRRKRSRRAIWSVGGQPAALASAGAPLGSPSARIAVLVESLSDHHTTKIISGIEVAAEKTGYEIAILNVLGKRQPLIGLDSFEGFIACCSDETAVDPDFFEKLGKPVIVVGNVENVRGAHCIKTNYQKGARLAVNHLIDQGCQNILMIAPAGNRAVDLDKYLGYRDALKDLGKNWMEPLSVSEASIEAGMNMAARMFEKGELPDGVFITNDWIAAGFVKYLKKKKDCLEAKTVVVGFGNESLCEIIEPGWSSIDFRKEVAGSTALHVLFEHLGDLQRSAGDGLTVIEPVLAIRV